MPAGEPTVYACVWETFAYRCVVCGEWFTGPEAPDWGDQALSWYREHYWPFSARHSPSGPYGPHRWEFVDILVERSF